MQELKARTWRDYLYTHVHSSLFIIAKKQQQPKCSVNEWLNKCDIFTYNKILLSLKKEGHLDNSVTWGLDSSFPSGHALRVVRWRSSPALESASLLFLSPSPCSSVGVSALSSQKLMKEGRKKENSDICCNMSEPWGYQVKWNKPEAKDKYCMITLT